MRAEVGRVWIASCAVLSCMGALSAACSTSGTSDVARSVSAADVDGQPHQSDGTASDVASVVGTWEFAALTGVPPAELPIQEAALAQVWKHGGRVIACDQGEIDQDDPDDPMRTAMRQMMGVFAQLERGMVVARLRRGRQLKREQHGYAQGRPPYGYRAEGGSLVKSPEEQIVIGEALRLRKGGHSLREIAAQLEAKGYRTRIGGSWHPAQVSRLFLERKTHVARRDA